MKEISFDQLNVEEREMQSRAMKVTSQCRLLKSTTKVGACIKSDADKYYSGCNFDWEFGRCVHAEESAITNMINNGDFDNENIFSIYLYADREMFTSCGDCRDKLRLYAVDPDLLRVYVDNGITVKMFDLSELLPFYPKR